MEGNRDREKRNLERITRRGHQPASELREPPHSQSQDLDVTVLLSTGDNDRELFLCAQKF